MDIKSVKILNLLLRKEEYVSYKEISLQLGIVERTIRYEIENLKAALAFQDEAKLQQDRKKGLFLEADRQQKISLVNRLHQQAEAEFLSNEERLLLIAVSLLREEERLTQPLLRERFGLGQTTVKTDKKKLELILDEYGIVLESDVKQGYYLAGSERGIRNFIFQLFTQSVDLETMLFSNSIQYCSEAEQAVLFYLGAASVTAVKEQLRLINHRMQGSFSDIALNHMSLTIAIQKQRIARQHLISQTDCQDKLPSGDNPYLAEIVKVIFGNDLPPLERVYLGDYIAGFSRGIEMKALRQPNWLELQLDTIELILAMEKCSGRVPLRGHQIRETLFHHVEVMIHRLKNDIQVYNPLTRVIKEKYHDIFQHCQQAVRFLEEKYKKTISDEELAYLTIYFYTYMEIKEPLKAVVICGQGFATGNLLVESLKKHFNFDIIGVFASFEKNIVSRLDVDLIITTIPVGELAVPAIQVSAIPDQQDINKINEFIQTRQISRTSCRKQKYELLMEQITELAKDCSTELNTEKFAGELSALLYKHKLINKRSVYQPMLKDILTKECIQLNRRVSDWEEAIRLAAVPLLNSGAIEERYVKAMIDSIHQYGPYIVIAENAALAHARPEDGAKAVGISITTLSEPVVFGNEEYDPVRIVVCLSAVDSSSHLLVLSNIAEIINSRKYIDEMLACSDVKQFLEIIERGEEEVGEDN